MQWASNRLWLTYLFGFAGTVLLIGVLEAAGLLGQRGIAWSFMALTIAVYAVIGILSRTNKLDDYYVAGRNVPGIYNGMATGSDWMSAASFISMAGQIYALGYDGLAYIMGWTGGYVLLAVFLAPYIRKFGKYTIPDFIAARYGEGFPRIVAVICAILVSFTYVTAQVTGVGIITSRFLEIPYSVGVYVGLAGILVCSFLGGMKAVTWTQVAQYIILIIAYLVPAVALSAKLTGIPIPQLMYGQALQNIDRLEHSMGLQKFFIEPFQNMNQLTFLALTLCLMAGTAGLPHILVRFYTVPSVREARYSCGWALFFIFLLYFTAPAYAAFARWNILQNVVGQKIASLPGWVATYTKMGLLSIKDANGDGILQYAELTINPDLIVLSAPEIAGMPYVIAGLVAAGGLAAALSTADGLLMVISTAISHDVYFKLINPRASTQTRFFISKAMLVIVAIISATVAQLRLAFIAQMVAWAFSLAAASFFPALVMGVWWKRTNRAGAISGMVAGFLVTALYMYLNYTTKGAFHIGGITHVAAGIFGMPINFLVSYVVSKLTAAPPQHIQDLVTELRYAKRLSREVDTEAAV